MAEKPTEPANRRARKHPAEAQKAAGSRRWASIQQTAEYIGVTTRTVRQMIADSRLTGYRNGKRLVRVDLNEVDAAMQPFGGAA